jgi:RNA polymerase sigma-70 factor (ECF subfamily)
VLSELLPTIPATPAAAALSASTALAAMHAPALSEPLPLGARDVEDLFSKLYTQYEQAIYAYVYRMLGDPEDARDFTQDAFVKAYRKLPDTLAKGNFQPQAWLYRIATNVCLDELRHRKLLKWQPWETFVSLFHPSQVARDNPERDAMQLETRSEVATVLEQLSPRYRAALMLREYHGLGYEEISAIMGTSRTAVKTLLLRARESFRLHYAKMHPTLAAQARGPRVLPRAMGRPTAAAAVA